MSAPIYGRWAVFWADASHPGIDRMHLLRAPLQSIMPGGRVNADRATALDFSSQTTVLYGVAYEMASAIKADDNRRSLQDMMLAAMSGQTLTLRDLDQVDRSASVYVVDPVDTWTAVRDQRGAPWELETPLRFRKTDGTAFPDWWLYQAYGESGILLKWEPGMSLADATFTRAGTATYTDVNGTVQTDGAAANVARDAHWQTDPVTGLWVRTLRMESAESESLTVPWPHAPQAMTVYCKFVPNAIDSETNGSCVWMIGGATSGATPRLLMDVYNGYYRFTHADGTGTDNAIASTTSPTNGDTVELAATVTSGAVLTLYQSLNGGAITSGTDASPAASLQSAWSAETLYLGKAANALYTTNDYLSLKVAAGVHTMAHMRSL